MKENPTKKTELYESAQKWRSTFDAIEEAVSILGRNHEIIEVNAAMEKLLDMPKVRLVGNKCYRIFHNKAKPPGFCPYMKTVESLKREEAIINSDGRYLRITIDPIIGDDSELRGIVQIITDVSEQIRIENNFRFQAALLDNTNNAVISTDPDYMVKTWNKAAERLFGFSSDKAIGKKAYDLIPESFPKSIFAGKSAEFRKSGYWRGESVHIDSKSRTIDIVSSVNLVKNDKGESLGLIAIIHDISELKKTEKKLREKHSTLAQVLNHMEEEQNNFKSEICSSVVGLFEPVIQKLKNRDGKLKPHELTILDQKMKLIENKGIDLARNNLRKLTPRELDVAERIKSGLSSKEIARDLDLSLSTIEVHRKSIRRKLQLKNKKHSLATHLRVM